MVMVTSLESTGLNKMTKCSPIEFLQITLTSISGRILMIVIALENCNCFTNSQNKISPDISIKIMEEELNEGSTSKENL